MGVEQKLSEVKRQLEAIAGTQVRVIVRSNGHVQLHGRLLVNWYPLSKKRTAYVDGTTEGVANCDAEQAVRMALTPPALVPKSKQDSRRGSYRKVRAKLLRKSSVCKWCETELTLDTSTLDHIIPLARGGIDHWTNWCLACEACNASRGHNMPEVGPINDFERQWRKEASAINEKLNDWKVMLVSLDARLAVVEGENRAHVLRSKATVLEKILRYQTRLKWLNVQLSEIESAKYQARFAYVAKEVLPTETYEMIKHIVEQKNDDLELGSDARAVQGEDHSGQHQQRGTPAGNDAVGVSSDSPF